ncbi:MAG: hypothetical protein RI996_57 [Candidatus Parcubacteria bacterium]|jgi:hypothetical protein
MNQKNKKIALFVATPALALIAFVGTASADTAQMTHSKIGMGTRMTNMQGVVGAQMKNTAAMDAHLQAKVTSGKLTQAQADQIKAERVAHEAQHKLALATALGISVQTLDAEIAAGKTIDQLATARGLTTDALKAKLQAAREVQIKARLAADVAAGKITQAQADQMIAKGIPTSLKNKKGQGSKHINGQRVTIGQTK